MKYRLVISFYALIPLMQYAMTCIPEKSPSPITAIRIANITNNPVYIVPTLIYYCNVLNVSLFAPCSSTSNIGTMSITQDPIKIDPKTAIIYQPPEKARKTYSGFIFTKNHIYDVIFKKNSKKDPIKLMSFRLEDQKLITISEKSEN